MIAEGMLPDISRATAAMKRGEPIPPMYRSHEQEPPVVPKTPATPPAITPVEYGGLQAAYDHFNAALFDGGLPNVFITYQRRARSGGYFAPDRFSSRVNDRGNHEMALSRRREFISGKSGTQNKQAN
jgi:hypothetical protein